MNGTILLAAFVICCGSFLSLSSAFPRQTTGKLSGPCPGLLCSRQKREEECSRLTLSSPYAEGLSEITNRDLLGGGRKKKKVPRLLVDGDFQNSARYFVIMACEER